MAVKDKKDWDFSGWATVYNTLCSDGRKILPKAFEHSDGKTIPLVWQHLHDDPINVLGHVVLEHRDKGVYAYGWFNEGDPGIQARTLVKHGDVNSLSIYANQLVEKNKIVHSGNIREVSLVLSGANEGAVIDHLSLEHNDGTEEEVEDEAIIKSGELVKLAVKHSFDDEEENDSDDTEEDTDADLSHADSEKTVGDVFDTLNEEQKNVVYAIIANLLDSGDISQSEDEGETFMKKNVFNKNDDESKTTLSHADMVGILEEARKNGSLKDAIRTHMEEKGYLQHAGTYGIDDIAYLFPDAQTLDREPSFETRRMGWVPGWMSGTRHTPFSRIKKLWADLTADEARAKGYVTGNQKVEQVFAILKRETTPTTVYKKQKLDRDDIVDITDFDVVAWMWREMRFMLEEEIARAALVGDGRVYGTDDDAINPACIRPIYGDDVVFVEYLTLESTVTDYADIIDAFIAARVGYKGMGSPNFYTTNAVLTAMRLLKDTTGRRIYSTIAELAAELNVAQIIEVEVLEGVTRDNTTPAYTADLLGIMVNPYDYTYGTDRGGEINNFDDFDIDFNQQKYLTEARLSGSLLNPKSALVVERKQA